MRYCTQSIPIVEKIKFPIQMARGGVFSMDQLRGKCPCFSQLNPMHSIKKKTEIPAFLTLKTSSTPAFPAPGEAPLSLTNTQIIWLSHSIPILQTPILLGEVPVPSYLETMGPDVPGFEDVWLGGPYCFVCLLLPKLQSGSQKSGVYFMCKHTYVAGYVNPFMIDATLWWTFT